MQKGVPSGTPLAGRPAVICLLAEFREQRVVVRADGFALREVVLHADALHVDRDLRLIVVLAALVGALAEVAVGQALVELLLLFVLVADAASNIK